MEDMSLNPGALVIYKMRPGRIKAAGEKVEIELAGGPSIKVRPKDVRLLHPGPLTSLAELEQTPAGDVETAWELLAGSTITLRELAELVYGGFSPASSWAAWQLVADGLYFQGDLAAVEARTPEEVKRELAGRQAREREEKAWDSFLTRLNAGKWQLEDAIFLREVENIAFGRIQTSRVLRELKIPEQPSSAHAFLLELGFWDHQVNPHPARLGLALKPPDGQAAAIPDEARLDLTHLPAYAIDDEGNLDPDDAVSMDGEHIWVHVADAAAIIQPRTEADEAARNRGASLYLPEGTVPMLPPDFVDRLGLGLKPISAALSFKIALDSDGQIATFQVAPSWIKVERMTYQDAQERLDDEPFKSLYAAARRYEEKRLSQGAISIDLPEVRMHVDGGQVSFYPVVSQASRDLVREAMLMAGEAAARLAIEHAIPVPFATQAPATTDINVKSEPGKGSGMADMFALRKAQNRGQVSSMPRMHAGLGLQAYVRATSPLRRYLDLVAHQQIRSFLRGEPLLDQQEMIARLGEAEAATSSVVRAESLSRQHWTLVYLMQNPGWKGQGVLVEKRGRRGRILIPELAYETNLSLPGDPSMDSVSDLAFQGADLPELEGYFKIVYPRM
jgi:exoribonuclease II